MKTQMSLFAMYLEEFRRHLSIHALVNGYYGTELPERELRGVIDDLCEMMRVDSLHARQKRWVEYDEVKHNEVHAALKLNLLKMIFSSKQHYWGVEK